MPDDLRPANPDDLVHSIAHALSYRAGKRSHQNDGLAYRAMATALLEHLARSNYVVMQKPVAMSGPDNHYGPSAREASGRK